MITLTENAKDYLTDMVSKSEDTYARLSVKGGGCPGFEYKWETTDTTDKGTLIDDILVLDKMIRDVCTWLHSRLHKRIWWFLLDSK